MVLERIDLYQYFGKKRREGLMGYLNVYAPKGCCVIEKPRKKPSILILAGGAYAHVSKREQEPVAFKFIAEGFCAFTLDYTCVPNAYYPTQLLEACMALAYIKENADKYELKEDKTVVAGFSAGGHLTAMLHCLYNEQVVLDYLGEKAKYCRPDAVILGYPVIYYKKDDPSHSVESLANGEEKVGEYLCMQKRVHKKVCPAFIFTTFSDISVPMEHSLKYATALRKNKIPFEMMVFEKGQHGLSVANELCGYKPSLIKPRVATWADQAINWLKERDFKIDVIS